MKQNYIKVVSTRKKEVNIYDNKPIKINVYNLENKESIYKGFFLISNGEIFINGKTIKIN